MRNTKTMSTEEENKKGAAMFCCGCSLLISFILFGMRIVPPATVAVVTTFGKVESYTMDSGLQLVNPFSKLVFFSTKTVLLSQQNHVPTTEGLTVDLDVALLYHIDPAQARAIYLSLGVDFPQVILEPEIASAVRGLTSEAEAKALYTEGRSELQTKLKEQLRSVLAPRGIVVEDVLLKAVALPELLKHAIELKAQAEQESARMAFVLAKEKQEAERKSIEASGIASFQRIVSDGISPQLLQWKGIEATERLAESPNAKIVLVGNSQQSLPVILSADDHAAAASSDSSFSSDHHASHSNTRGEL